MGRLFGTDGVRGIANKELTCKLAYKLGQAGALVLAEETQHVPKILVGRDTRISGDMLEKALIAGICSTGAHVGNLGIIPTPAVAFLVRKYRADAGVVISASHNPYQFNGIKFFNSEGYKLSDSIEEKIEDIVLNKDIKLDLPVAEKVGYSNMVDGAVTDYIEMLKEAIKTDLSGLKIAVDCANGASFEAAPKVLTELGAKLEVIHAYPDGVNINRDCGSTHMESLRKYTVENKCDVGLAFDGDADRVLAVDENGNIVNGDQIMAILALDLKNRKELVNNTVVVTVMSNLGLDIMAKENGIILEKTKVGDRYVLEQMLLKGHILGGEQSGHIILLDYNTTGDGLLSALNLLKVLKMSGEKLSVLASVMKVYPQVLVNAKVSNEKKMDYLKDSEIADKCRKLEELFHGEGRVLIRPSGTEPLIRVMIEGKDQEFIAKKAKELATYIEERLG